MSEFHLFVEENGFEKYAYGYRKIFKDSIIAIKKRGESFVSMSYYDNNHRKIVEYNLIMSIDGNLKSNGMSFKTLEKIIDNTDIIYDEIKRYNQGIFLLKNSFKCSDKKLLSVDTFKTEIFHLDDDCNRVVTFNFEDGLIVKHNDAIWTNDSFV